MVDFNIDKHIIFKTLTGSRVYGTHNEDSDYDYRGIVIPPKEYFYSFRKEFDSHTELSSDTTLYSLNKFLSLAAKNNPNVLELLYIPSNFWMRSSNYWKVLVDNRNRFLSKKCYYTYFGYINNKLKDLTPFDASALGEKRKKLVEKYGYDTKGMTHIVRLVLTCGEILQDKTIKVVRPEIPLLQSIRNGEWSLGIFKDWFQETSGQIDLLFKSSDLQDNPDVDSIEQLGVTITERFLNEKTH